MYTKSKTFDVKIGEVVKRKAYKLEQMSAPPFT